MRIILAITGASGVTLAQRFVAALPLEVELFIIQSNHAKIVFEKEHQITFFEDTDIAAAVASGSFKCEGMIVLPCSMNTLAKIACGISDNLTTRTAAVMIKEHRKLILAPRELPFSAIALENMLKLASLQVLIAPPVLGYYSAPKTIEEMEHFLIGKWFDLLGIQHTLFKRWGEK